MQFEREYVSLIIFKQRQQELLKEAEQQRLVSKRLEVLRQNKNNKLNADENATKDR